MQAKLLDTQEHFPDLHALVGLVQPHLIRLSNFPGAKRIPGGIMVGVMEEVEPVTCVQPWFVGSRLEGSGSRADVNDIRPGLYTLIIEGNHSNSTIHVDVPHVGGLDFHI